MFKRLIALFALLGAASGTIAALNCNVLSTFPTTTISGVAVPVCTAACPTVRPPVCTGSAGAFQTVNFSSLSAASDPTGLTPSTAGYQIVNVGGAKLSGDGSGLANDATVYSASIAVDGTVKPITVTGSAAQTISTLLTQINNDLGSSATAALVSGNIKITSNTIGSASSVAITDVDLFSTLTDFASIASAVAGTQVTYTASVLVNATTYPISVTGSAADTFEHLVAEIDADLGAQGSVALDVPNKQIKFTSLSTGVTSTVVITPGTLFAAPLANFTSLSPVIVGGIPAVTPKNSKAIGDYTSVTCTNIATFPTVTHNGTTFPKCVQKCQQIRPPACVDYNSELN